MDPLTIDEKFIINIFKKYLKIKLILVQSKENQIQEKEVLYGKKSDFNWNYQNYLKIIETILALMPKDEYDCLVKEFLTVNSSNWWKKIYSYSQYQILKQKAIKRFLYLFLL